MVEAVAFEARGESLSGKRAVANVILNRVDNTRRFPNTVCGVLRQPYAFSHIRTGRTLRDIVIDNPREYQAMVETVRVSVNALVGRMSDNTLGADHFFNPNVVRPSWAENPMYGVVIGGHEFVRLYPDS